jgi:hypothetical protein
MQQHSVLVWHTIFLNLSPFTMVFQNFQYLCRTKVAYLTVNGAHEPKIDKKWTYNICALIH